MIPTDIFSAVIRGTVAGAVGTAAMTLSERVEMALTGRAGSQVPGQVGAHLVPGKDPGLASDVAVLNLPVHWAHGISMGVLRGLLDAAGLRGSAATAVHFAVLWAGDAALYRGLGIADVPWRWSPGELGTDVLHKGVYAVVTGATYDALTSSSR